MCMYTELKNCDQTVICVEIQLFIQHLPITTKHTDISSKRPIGHSTDPSNISNIYIYISPDITRMYHCGNAMSHGNIRYQHVEFTYSLF